VPAIIKQAVYRAVYAELNAGYAGGESARRDHVFDRAREHPCSMTNEAQIHRPRGTVDRAGSIVTHLTYIVFPIPDRL
jgi:hypothetical protein